MPGAPTFAASAENIKKMNTKLPNAPVPMHGKLIIYKLDPINGKKSKLITVFMEVIQVQLVYMLVVTMVNDLEKCLRIVYF
jgi:hypothetical protein